MNPVEIKMSLRKSALISLNEKKGEAIKCLMLPSLLISLEVIIES